MKGDEWDFNTPLLYNGASKYIEPMVDFGVKIIMDTYIPRWSREKAKEAVRKAILENGGKIDAILAPMMVGWSGGRRCYRIGNKKIMW